MWWVLVLVLVLVLVQKSQKPLKSHYQVLAKKVLAKKPKATSRY